MLIWIFLCLGLYFVQTLLPPALTYTLKGRFIEAMGARDTAPPESLGSARARRALTNMNEAMIIFLPLAVLAQVGAPESSLATWGGAIFFFSRIAYLLSYLGGVYLIRSILWLGGLLGIVLVGLCLF